MARRYRPLPAGAIVWLHAGQWCQGRGWVLEDPGLHAGRLAVLVLIDDGSGRPMSAQLVPGKLVLIVARRRLVTEDERARRAAALALANAGAVINYPIPDMWADQLLANLRTELALANATANALEVPDGTQV